jgi:hypothetical protein
VRATVDAFGDLDGVRYNSRFAEQPGLALFMAAHSAMPMRLVVSLPLTHLTSAHAPRSGIR